MHDAAGAVTDAAATGSGLDAALGPGWHGQNNVFIGGDGIAVARNGTMYVDTNTGNTFQQVYASGTVLGTPIAGPNVGVKFPTEDYVAVPIGGDQVYITWQDPKTYAIVDVFVMNLQTHTVYDYAPGSAKPQSAGYIKVVCWPAHGLPR